LWWSSGKVVEQNDIVVSLNSENGTKVTKLAKDFDIPTTTLTTVSKNEDKIISHIFLEYVYAKARWSKRQS